MTVSDYFAHYLKTIEFWKFLGLSIVTILIVSILIYIYSLITCKTVERDKKNPLRAQLYHITEKFNELIFSGTSILMFMSAYYLIERFLNVDKYLTIWNKYKDFLLLLFIVISCVFNTLLDHVLIRQRHIKRKDIAPIRLLGMLYMILIFCYIKFIYGNNNYDFFITYFLGIMVGRFVYFDASFKDTLKTIKEAARNIPLLFLALGSTGLLSLYGFSTKYLIKHIGVLTNVFFIHLFMCVTIFILYHSHLIDLVSRNSATRSGKKKATDSDDEFDEAIYDDEEYVDDEEYINDEEYVDDEGTDFIKDDDYEDDSDYEYEDDDYELSDDYE